MIKKRIFYNSSCNNLITIVVEEVYFLGILIKETSMPYELYKINNG